MVRLSSSRLRQQLAETINRVVDKGERVILERRGQDVAVLVSVQDWARFEELEDRLDYEEAEDALAASRAKREKPIPWKKAKKALGLS